MLKLKRLKKQVTKTLVSAGLLFSILGSTVVGAENLTPTPTVSPSTTLSTTPSATDSNNSGSNGTLISSDGTANSRLQVFIRQAAGKQVNEDSESMSTMSQQDAYFLGVYLSNFFIPYGTEFGTDDALQEENVKEAVETFKTNLNFSEDTAKSLAETIIGLSRSNNQELQFVVSKDYQDGKYEQLDDVVLSQYTLFSAMSGKLANMMQDEIPIAGLDEGYYNAAKDKEGTSDSEENDGTVVSKDWNYIQNLKVTAFNPDLKTIIYDDRSGSESSNNEIDFFASADYAFKTYDEKNKTKLQDKLKTFKSLKDSDDGTTETTKKMKKCAPYKYGYLAYKNGDTWTPVLDFSLYYRYGMTASQVAFWKAFESVNFEKGYGTNIFDFSQSEVDENDDYKGLKTYFSTDSDWYNMSIFGSRVVVDCFGNIMIVGKNHQFIAVPACMNPYTWQMVDENGVDDSKCKAGECYNLLNLLSMTFQDDDRMFITSSIGDLKRGKSTLNANIGTPAFKALEGRIDGDSYTARINRDTDKTSLKSGPFGWGIFSTSESSALTMAKKGANAEGDYSLNTRLGGDSNTLDIFMPKKVDGTFSMSNYHKINFFDGMVFIDNLGAFHFDDSNNDLDWSLFNVEHYLNSEKEGLNKLYEKVGGTTFGSVISNIKDGAMSSVSATETNKTGIVAIYLTYVYSSLYEEDTKADTIGKLGYRMSTGIYPEIVNKPLGVETSGEDKMSTSIKEWLYYLLNPTKGYNYVTTLISNKARALLVSWHNDMLGTKGVGNITGTTKYRGNVGYVTTPDLSDIEWTDNMLDFWNSAIPYVAIFMLVAFVFVYLAGILNLHRCIFGLIIFCVCLLIPVPMINGVVGASNKVISNMYGEKFTYWAMIQHESYSKAIDEAADGDDYGNYLRTLYATNSAINVNQGSESIKLRWQAPKKMSSLMYSKKDNNALKGIRKSFIVNALTQAYSGEAYLDDDYYYLYRSYLDISNFSRYIYRGIKSKIRSHYNVLTENNTKGLSSKLKKKLKGLSKNGAEWTAYDDYRKDGYTNRTKGSSGLTNEIHVVVPVSSKIYSEAVGGRSDIANLDIDTYTGINQDYFNFSIPMFNKKDSEATEDSEAFSLKDSMTSSAKSSDFKFNKYSESDYVGLAAYGLYSESVFYYYSWVLYDQGMTPETSSTTGYKDLLLKNYKSSTNANYFYNNKGNGELKDFLDMRSLFTYIIPYLHDGNRMVTKWEETYGGLKIYDGVSSEEGQSGNYTTAEMKQKYWNNLNVARLYNVYTPWVDLMYDCNYSKPEKISVLGKEVTINDPINPSSYPDERPMIFSRSEMADYGLKEGDLTKVESLIIKCNDEFQESMFDLLNYHNFNDVVLNTAAAMNCAFIFNKNFSESGLLGTNNKEIYPQSFEISDFSYDAFLRFILANSTGESMTGSDDFYMNIVQSSSITSAIVMLILDIASMYVLPGIKIFFVILVFLASILAILVSLLHVDEEHKFITRLITSVVTPMVKYFIVTMGMAYLISLFMGVGNDSITNMHTATIQLGDPVMVMIAMLLVDVIAIILYYRIIKSVWQSVRQMGKMVGNVGTGCMVAAGGFVTGLAAGSMRGVSGGGMSSGGMNGESGEANGVANGRASKRATSNLGSGGVANGRDVVYKGDNGEVRKPGSGTRKAETPKGQTKYDEAYGKKRQNAVQGKTRSGLSRLNENRRERRKVNKYMDTYFDKLDSYEKGKEKEAEDAIKKEAKDKARSEKQDKKRAEAKYRRELREESNERARRERYKERQERDTARYRARQERDAARYEDRVRKQNERTVSREVKRLERDANAEMRSQRREHRKRDREMRRYDGK